MRRARRGENFGAALLSLAIPFEEIGYQCKRLSERGKGRITDNNINYRLLQPFIT